MGGFVAANVVLAFRHRPPFRAMPSEANLERYREVVEPLRAWVVVAVAGLLALVAGGSAAGQWRSYLLWRNGGDFGTRTPTSTGTSASSSSTCRGCTTSSTSR